MNTSEIVSQSQSLFVLGVIREKDIINHTAQAFAEAEILDGIFEDLETAAGHGLGAVVKLAHRYHNIKNKIVHGSSESCLTTLHLLDHPSCYKIHLSFC